MGTQRLLHFRHRVLLKIKVFQRSDKFETELALCRVFEDFNKTNPRVLRPIVDDDHILFSGANMP
jgi:hypothetical protein